MAAPTNVKLETPSIKIDNWPNRAKKWLYLNDQIGGHQQFYPLTIKGAYVIGIIYSLCESVEHLLKHDKVKNTTYLPAYGIFASSVELLGRCINGNDTDRHATKDLKKGFQWLADPKNHEKVSDRHILVKNGKAHTIERLITLRHFTVHGQANAKHNFQEIDYTILEKVRPKLANGLDYYWEQLKVDSNLCNQLAQANILAFRNGPVLKTWALFGGDQRNYPTVAQIFRRFDWRVG